MTEPNPYATIERLLDRIEDLTYVRYAAEDLLLACEQGIYPIDPKYTYLLREYLNDLEET